MKKLSDWRSRALTVLALFCTAGGAAAADLGFYVVLDKTASSADVSRSDFNAELTGLWQLYDADPVVTDVSQQTKPKGYAFTVGYQLGSYFAVEGSFIEFGKVRYDHNVTFESIGGPFNGRLVFKPRGPTVSAVGLLPLGPYFSLDAHAGFFFIDSKYKISLTDTNGVEVTDPVEISDSKTSLYYGAGFAWWATGQVALRVGYNMFHKAVFEKNASQYSLGIRYSYGY